MTIFPFIFINRGIAQTQTSEVRSSYVAKPPFEVNHQQGIRISRSSTAIDTLDDPRLQRFAELLSDIHTPMIDISMERTRVLMNSLESEQPALALQMCEMTADFYATIKERRGFQRYYNGPRFPHSLKEATDFLAKGLKHETLNGEKIGRLKREVWKFGGTKETTDRIALEALA